MEDDRPLVFLIVSHGWTMRNYVLGDFLPALTQACRVVVCTPLADDPKVRSTVLEVGAGVEPLLKYGESWLHRRVTMRQTLYHFAWCGTGSMKIKFARARSWYGGVANLRNRVDQAIAKHLSSPLTLRTLDWLDARFRTRSDEATYYRQLFHERTPAVVFSTASVMKDEWVPLYVAQEMGIPTAVAVMSWDNLTSKGRLPYGCDQYLTWTEGMKHELLDFHPDVESDQVVVGGSPQFDFHVHPDFHLTREEFCREVGLVADRPIVVYSGVTPGLMPHEPEVVASLVEAVRAGRIHGDPQLLVRPHPVDDGARYRGFRERFPEVALFIPGEKAGGDERRLVASRDDLRMQISTVVHGAVHLNVASTMTLDAAALDRPVVNVRYDPRPSGVGRSVGMDIYEHTHYRPVLVSGAVRVARSPDELVAHVNAYLLDPSLDREGRRQITRRICGGLDGRSGQRTAELIARIANGGRAGAPRDAASSEGALAV